mgnify:CR=1 FL=1
MPTILEHLAALFDKDMRAVLSNPRAISMIASTTFELSLITNPKGIKVGLA